MLQKARQIYQLEANKHLKKFKLEKSDQKFIDKLIKGGTIKDRIAAIYVYIQENSKFALQSIEQLLQLCNNEQKRVSLMAIHSMKDLWIECLLDEKYFFNTSIPNMNDHNSLIDYYFSLRIQEIYNQYLNILQTKTQNGIFFEKKQILEIIFELINEKPFFQAEKIIVILVNKFVDQDRQIINLLNKNLGLICQKSIDIRRYLIKEFQSLILRPNVRIETQFYAFNFLNNLNYQKFEMNLIQEIIQFYFKLLKILLDKQTVKSDLKSSKILQSLLKGINKFFKVMKSNPQIFKNFFEVEINNLFKLIHKTENFKIKIQCLLFIFQAMKFDNNLTNRYYRVLYEILLSQEIQNSSQLEIFFDLMFFSIKEDLNERRIKAIIKRLVQNSLHGPPNFIITTLIFIAKIIEHQPTIKTLFQYSENYYNEEDEEEIFKDVDIEAEENDQKEEKEKNKLDKQKKYQYNPYKKEPEFSNAEKTSFVEIVALCEHYHPTVNKFARDLLNENYNQILKYQGNPLLDFSLANFLDRLQFKRGKKIKSKGLKQLQQKNKLRMSRISEPLSFQSVLEANKQLAVNEEFMLKYFEQKRELKQQQQQQQFKEEKEDSYFFNFILFIAKQTKEEENDESDIDNFADELFDEELQRMEGAESDDELDFEESDLDNDDDDDQLSEEDEQEGNQEDDFQELGEILKTSGQALPGLERKKNKKTAVKIITNSKKIAKFNKSKNQRKRRKQ